MPTTNGNGHIDADEDITMDTEAEAVTDQNMAIDTHPIPLPIRTSLYFRSPKMMKEIWQRVCTAPSSVPGVHIFSLEEPRPRFESAFTPRWMPLGPPRLGPRDGGYGWFFRNAKAVTPSFDAHNPSTYLTDSGLWTACKQSRDVMREAYGFASWNRMLGLHSGMFLNELKRQNLLDLPVLNAIWDWKMPLGRDLWTLCYLPNVALELNPAWGHNLSPTDHEANSKLFIVAYIAGLAAMFTPNSTLWFVDERLKRKSIAPTQEQVATELKRRAFYGSDRQYVEVMGNGFPLDHDQWELLPQEILGMTDPPICDPFGTGGYLWTWIEDRLDSEGDGLHWSGEWFIHTLQYYIKAKAKAQREVDWILGQARVLLSEAQEKLGHGNPIDTLGNPTNGNRGENGNGNGEHHDDENCDYKDDDGMLLNAKRIRERNSFTYQTRFDGSEVSRFGLLAVEYF
ncbi:uncharacterized protein Triagg1_8051 [Trichoderma aggressivum f. europaeum]|uniref:Uncharacterized protein n=1 Tax=Trichoderma aggressivum f. europaeum TaxID=173218 RepID=A0AAE1J4G7_9HYPO|nr:hypothetical protein Triagg1_8051 [Trichoderma aggressivum f. europaeum]